MTDILSSSSAGNLSSLAEKYSGLVYQQQLWWGYEFPYGIAGEIRSTLKLVCIHHLTQRCTQLGTG